MDDETLLPVLTALESAEALRRDLDVAEAEDDRGRIRQEVERLRHWLRVSDQGREEYAALLDGLGAYADEVDRNLQSSGA